MKPESSRGIRQPGGGPVDAKLGGSLYGISLTPAGSFGPGRKPRTQSDERGGPQDEIRASFLSAVATVSLPENPVDIDLSPDGDYAFTISEAEKKACGHGDRHWASPVCCPAGPARPGTNLVLAGVWLRGGRGRDWCCSGHRWHRGSS